MIDLEKCRERKYGVERGIRSSGLLLFSLPPCLSAFSGLMDVEPWITATVSPQLHDRYLVQTGDTHILQSSLEVHPYYQSDLGISATAPKSLTCRALWTALLHLAKLVTINVPAQPHRRCWFHHDWRTHHY